ncbi:flagellar associated protein [Scenedesmus sp. NREL 46B-D3]|nr:flagellar associated protein [Scenedesmus sp. NREL 46B-D3]
MGVMGHSGHKNIANYRGGVLIGNFYEEAEHRLTTSQGQQLLGLGAPFVGQATSAAAQKPEGRMGAELAASYTRTDLSRVGKCVPASLKFTHGDPHEPPMQCFATVNQLAFGEKSLGEPAVQQYLWSGKTRLNAFVPISTPEGSNGSGSTALGNTKRSQWARAADDDMYSTSAQVAADSTALQAAANSAACHTARCVPPSEDGPALVGKKAAGQFAAELDKNYHAIGLRK